MHLMRSLRARLLAVLMATVLLAWAIWLACQYVQTTHLQSDQNDRMVRGVAEHILLSLPDDIDTIRPQGHLQLPPDATLLPETKFDKIVFQVWVLDRRESVVASTGAPATPLRADFAVGHADAQVDGRPWRTYAVTDATGQVQVQAGVTHAHLHAELWRWIGASLKTALLVLAALAAALWLVVGWSLRPVTRLRGAIAERHALDLAPLPVAELPDEIRPLVDSFNQLLGRLDKAVHAERAFLAEAAHELRTPLAALLTQTQVALHSPDPQAALERLRDGIERLGRLAQQLLDSARIDADRRREEHGPLELAEIVALVVREFEATAARRHQTIGVTADAALGVAGNIDDLGILVRNLVDNAVRYAGSGGRIEVACRGDSGSGTVVLEVRDDGPGVPAEERERVFERFFRGSNGNGERGSGIGLSLVARIARSHGATVRTGTGIGGRGFAVEVIFPGLVE
ncbi:sensor histidine kinase [Dokdonella koreensis]|uniref:histidine kinase n=1 Tax=Dokdonella koreensis DS-123 TaxID=1300342 RepID=A0A160DT47_9GAMM|nr:ATP-binding protein [Dokdonella koreensis]ANB17518.1 Putative two component sensor kinase [Dokdonella koreensis DS-123]